MRSDRALCRSATIWCCKQYKVFLLQEFIGTKNLVK